MSQKLKELLATMNVPVKRIESEDYGWLLRNLNIQNGDHPQINEAIELLILEFNRKGN
jgi:hypothetical protein